MVSVKSRGEMKNRRARWGSLALAAVVLGGAVSAVSAVYAAPAFAAACTLSGTGANNDPYLVATTTDMAQIPDCGPAKSYRQTANIGPVTQMVPLALTTDKFTGSFNGQGFTTTLNITDNSATGVGLFPRVGGGVSFSNMVLTGTVTSASGQSIGSLIGKFMSSGSISLTDVHSSVNVSSSGGDYTGGIAGFLEGSTVSILRTSFTGEVNTPGSYTVGGFSSRFSAGTITDSYVRSASIKGLNPWQVGGFGGTFGSKFTITRSYSGSAVAYATIAGGGGIGGQYVSSLSATGGVFWDSTIGPATAFARGTPLTLTGATAQTTTQMQTLSTYSGAGWLITDTWRPYVAGVNLWGICPALNSGYPYLLAQFTESQVRTAGCTVFVPRTVPDAPTAVSATAGNGQASVAFTAPASDGGSAITGYTVTATNQRTSTTVTTSGISSPITVTGLINDDSYTFTVTATNTVGAGSSSTASTPVTPAAAQLAATGSDMTLPLGLAGLLLIAGLAMLGATRLRGRSGMPHSS